MSVLLSILVAVGIFLAIMGTAPWWMPLFDRPVGWWVDWVERMLAKRERP